MADREIHILIIGYGVVGQNLHRELQGNGTGKGIRIDYIDKYHPEMHQVNHKGKYDFAFICVDTPAEGKVLCDTSEVENAIRENPDVEIYVIKSTVAVGTTEALKKATGKRIVFSPEYYGGTQHCNNFRFDYTIVGGEKEDCRKVVQMLQRVYDGRHVFRMVDSQTAELVKYMENSYLATKVSFCNMFYRIAEKIGVSYEELRELFVLDPRVNESHTFVYDDMPYWDSHCLNKDVPSITMQFPEETGLLEEVISYNRDCRKEKTESDRTKKTAEGIENLLKTKGAPYKRPEIYSGYEYFRVPYLPVCYMNPSVPIKGSDILEAMSRAGLRPGKPDQQRVEIENLYMSNYYGCFNDAESSDPEEEEERFNRNPENPEE